MSLVGLGESHPFRAAGERFLYLAPSAAVVALDACAAAVVDALAERPLAAADLVDRLVPAFDAEAVDHALADLRRVRAVGEPASRAAAAPAVVPLAPVPLETLVVNVTNQCNLSCTYCYEYGEDRIVDAGSGAQPKFMSAETARASVDLLLRQSGPQAHMTFFGGETLMNFPVLQQTIAYARARAAEAGKTIDFSLTTNATLLRPDIIEYLADERVGVTISIDGPKDVQDRFRVFRSGAGSYETAMPKIKALMARHRTRPIGARVTLTSDTLDVARIYRHLHDEVGFWEVGFAPATSAAGRGHAIAGEGRDRLLAEFRALASEYLEAALAGRHHGFSNVRETLHEIHQGHAKAFPCGAGIGLLGVSTDGDVALCHRFAGSDAHRLGSVRGGVEWRGQQAFLDRHHIHHKTACQACWARPICAGGCYHEAHTRYGTTEAPNVHYCEWVRAWTHTCLEIYGTLAVERPAFLDQFDAPSPDTRPARDAAPAPALA